MTLLASLADEAFLRCCIAFAVMPVTYVVTWVYAVLRVPKLERRYFVSTYAKDLFIPMFLGVWGALIGGGLVWIVVGAFVYDRQFSALPFIPFWVVAYFIISIIAVRHVLIGSTKRPN